MVFNANGTANQFVISDFRGITIAVSPDCDLNPNENCGATFSAIGISAAERIPVSTPITSSKASYFAFAASSLWPVYVVCRP